MMLVAEKHVGISSRQMQIAGWWAGSFTHLDLNLTVDIRGEINCTATALRATMEFTSPETKRPAKIELLGQFAGDSFVQFFYKDTDHPFAPPHTILERNGVRIGVIGIMGQDAVSAIIPSFIAALDVTAPADAVRRSVAEIRDDVDLIVLLTHQGKTAICRH